jgi:hypothetical protein
MTETRAPKDAMKEQSRRQRTDLNDAPDNRRPQQPEDSPGIEQDDRFIGAERFPRKGDDE